MTAIWVEVTATRGSAPRDAGTAMKVTATATEGTIGGGALELKAIGLARKVLARGGPEISRTFPLGPDLGQCCGGAVTLKFTREPRPTDPQFFHMSQIKPNRPHPQLLWLWGAGHVGREVVRAAPAQAFKITWIDSAKDRFPPLIAPDAKAIPATDMPLLARRAHRAAHHLIFTYSHDIDFALCAALLERGVESIGLIGSDTKKARFFKRLTAMGLDPSPIVCPIGDKSLGKTPDAIARGTIAALMRQLTKEGVT